MDSIFLKMAFTLSISIFLAGCGGGGGSSPAKTQGAVTVYLFGTMSSSSKVATIQSNVTIPAGIMINYSSPPGASPDFGKYPLRSASIITPSGSTAFSRNDISAEYSISDRKLSIYCINNPDFSSTRKNIKSSISGNGTEIATIYFKLAAPDVFPVLPIPWQDPSVSVYQETLFPDPFPPETLVKNGLKLNFLTYYFP